LSRRRLWAGKHWGVLSEFRNEECSLHSESGLARLDVISIVSPLSKTKRNWTVCIRSKCHFLPRYKKNKRAGKNSWTFRTEKHLDNYLRTQISLGPSGR
jgi:hypothetical protein